MDIQRLLRRPRCIALDAVLSRPAPFRVAAYAESSGCDMWRLWSVLLIAALSTVCFVGLRHRSLASFARPSHVLGASLHLEHTTPEAEFTVPAPIRRAGFDPRPLQPARRRRAPPLALSAGKRCCMRASQDTPRPCCSEIPSPVFPTSSPPQARSHIEPFVSLAAGVLTVAASPTNLFADSP